MSRASFKIGTLTLPNLPTYEVDSTKTLRATFREHVSHEI